MTAKEITYSIIAVLLIAVIAFNSYMYWNAHDKELELTAEQNKRDIENDSLKMVNAVLTDENTRIKQDITGIGKEKEVIYKQYTDKTKKDISRPATEQGKLLIELIEK